MKKNYLTLIFTLSILLMLLLPSNVSAATTGYTIENYDINMVVNENNTYDITETITAYFDTPKHRNLQKNTFEKQNNKK